MSKNILSRLPIWVILGVTLVTPLLFFPFTPDALEFNKQVVVVAGGILALFFILVGALARGSFALPRSSVHGAALLALGATFLAALFSQDKVVSFLGFGFGSHEAFLTALAFVFLYFAVVIGFDRMANLWLLRILMIAGLAAGAISIIAASGIFKSIVPQDFSTVGSPSATGLFLAVSLAAAIGGAMFWIGRWQKFSLGASIFLFVAGALIFQDLLWLLFAVAAILMLLLHLSRLRKASATVLSTVFLGSFIGLALGFFLFAPLASFIPGSFEISPSLSLSLEIARKSLLDNPLFGVGPGNWVNAYNVYFPVTLNQGNFWNLTFVQAGSKMLTLPVTGGIVQFLTQLFFVGLVGLSALKNGYKTPGNILKNPFNVKGAVAFLKRRHSEPSLEGGMISMPSAGTDLFFPAFFVWLLLLLGQFFLGSNTTLEALFWIMSAVLVVPHPAQESQEVVAGEEPASVASLTSRFKFTKDSLGFQLIALVTAILVIVAVGTSLVFVRRYAAAAAFNNAANQINQKKIQDAITSLKFAVRMEPVNGFYLRTLSQAALDAFNTESSSKEELNKDKIGRINDYSSVAIAAVETAVASEPSRVENWYQRARVYGAMRQLGLTGADDKIFASLQKAMELAPQSPLFVTEMGNAQFYAWNNADTAGVSAKDKEKLLEDAEKSFKKAIDLKKDYTQAYFGLGVLQYRQQKYDDAEHAFRTIVGITPNSSDGHYLLGLTLDAKGNKKDAQNEFELVAKLNPDNEDVKKIIDNLKNGKSALEGIGSQAQAPTTSESGIVPGTSNKKP